MGASDYMVGNAPQAASYAAPLAGFAFGQAIAGLPEQYFQGTQRGLTLRKQNAFPDGMPVQRDANGKPVLDQNGNPLPDVNAIVNTGFQLGGADYAAGMLPYISGQSTSARQSQIDTGVLDYGGQPPAYPRTENKSGAGPGNIGGIRPPQQPAPQPQLTSAGTYSNREDDSRSDTIRSMVTELRGADNDSTPVISAAVRKLRISPDAALTSDQQTQVRNFVSQYAQAQPAAGTSEDIAPPFGATSAAERNQNGPGGNAAAPFMSSGASGAPGPQAGPSRVPAQVDADLPGSDNPAVLRAVAAVLPPGVNPSSYPGYVRALNRAIQSTLDNAAYVARFPNGAAQATQLQEKAKMYAAIRDRVLDAAKSAAEPTGSMKEWLAGRQPGETQASYEARAAGLKEGAVAPFRIAAAAIREGGRPVAIHPNEVVTTGSTLDPALKGITDWASQRLGLPGGEVAAPASAPNAAQGSPPGQSAFTPKMVRNPDGSVTSSITPSVEKLQTTAADNYEKARESYAGAQQTEKTLAEMEDSFRTLNKAGWSSTGVGAQTRLEMAKSFNSLWQTLGVKGQDLPFDPNTIASWEDLEKNSTRLGFALARTLGAREAMQIVQGAIKANPGVANTPVGSRMVLNSIRQNAQRDSDYFEFATNFAQTHGGDLVGAEVAFNKAYPPSLYARRAIVQAQRDIPQEAVEQLRQNPRLAEDFDKHYGTAGLAKMFLPQQGAR